MGCSTSTPEVKGGAKRPGDLNDEGAQNHVFLAVNGSSGGLVAQSLLDMQVPNFEIDKGGGMSAKIFVHIFNLKDNELRATKFNELAQLASDVGNDVRVIACGGDGTVKWVISELIKVNALSVPIGVIPFGTGNDMSRVLGWGSSPPSPLIGEGMKALRERIQVFCSAEVIPLDVWNCVIDLKEGGNFEEVKDKKVTATYEGKTSLTQEMINYFSIGADGELMFGFEQNRKTTQTGNKLVYVQKGVGQTLAPPKRLKKFLDSVTVPGEEEGAVRNNLDIGFSDRLLCFLNIPSYAAGADPWKRSKDAKTKKKSRFHPQYVGDNTVELFSMRSTANAGMAVALGSTLGIHRVSARKRFSVEFKENVPAVYFQVDGEAVKGNKPKSISVTHGYQVKMLRSKKAKAVAFPPGHKANLAEKKAEKEAEQEAEQDTEQEAEQQAEQQAEQEQVEKAINPLAST